jgi:quercetin dioxygenase-like cupin family protein
MKMGFSDGIVSPGARVPCPEVKGKGKLKTTAKTRRWTRTGALAALSVLGLAGFVVCSVLGITSFTGTALATTGSGFTTTSILGPMLFDEINVKTHTDANKVMIKTQGFSDVYIVTNLITPGGYSGWHSHPGPSLVTVKSGTATYYDGDDPTCTPQVVQAGNGFVDAGGGHVHMVRNEGTVDLELVALQIIPQGAARRIEAPDPGTCPF